jgi:hypothetical protein
MSEATKVHGMVLRMQAAKDTSKHSIGTKSVKSGKSAKTKSASETASVKSKTSTSSSLSSPDNTNKAGSKLSKQASVISSSTSSSVEPSTFSAGVKPNLRTTRVGRAATTKSGSQTSSILRGFSKALKTSPDIIVFGEYNWYDKSSAKKDFLTALEQNEYTLHHASAFCTPAIASKFPVERVEEVCLTGENSAVLVCVRIPNKENETAWVCCANFDHDDEKSYRHEVAVLMEWIEENIESDAKIIMNCDFHNESFDLLASDGSLDSVTDSSKIARMFKRRDFCLMADLTSKWMSKQTASTVDDSSSSESAVDLTFSRSVRGAKYFECLRDGLTVCDWYL